MVRALAAHKARQAQIRLQLGPNTRTSIWSSLRPTARRSIAAICCDAT
jgi:hypothetical protein